MWGWGARFCPPFNSKWSNWSATWEFSPAPLGCAPITWPTSFDPLGISVPSAVFTDALVWTTTLSPVLAVFESSLLTSSPLTGLISTAGASGLAAGLFGGADSVPGFCWVVGLFGWLAGGGCCAKRGKLAKANRVVASAVPVFMKNPPSVPTLPHPHIRGAVTRFPDTLQASCQTRGLRADCPKELTWNRLTFGRAR